MLTIFIAIAPFSRATVAYRNAFIKFWNTNITNTTISWNTAIRRTNHTWATIGIVRAIIRNAVSVYIPFIPFYTITAIINTFLVWPTIACVITFYAFFLFDVPYTFLALYRNTAIFGALIPIVA